MTTIQDRLIGIIPDPMRNDEIHARERLRVLKEVTETEVEKLLSTMSGKSSPMNFVPTSLLKELPDWLTSLFRKVGFHRALKRLK